jgi:hypothetical protein
MSNVILNTIANAPKFILTADVGAIDKELLEFVEDDWVSSRLGVMLLSQTSFRMMTAPLSYEQLNVCSFFDALEFFGKYKVEEEMPPGHRIQIFLRDLTAKKMIKDFFFKYHGLISKLIGVPDETLIKESIQTVGDYVAFPSIHSTFDIVAVDIYAQFAEALVKYLSTAPNQKGTYIGFIQAVKKSLIGYPDITRRVNNLYKDKKSKYPTTEVVGFEPERGPGFLG